MSMWETKLDKGVLTVTYSIPPMNYIGADGTRQMIELIVSQYLSLPVEDRRTWVEHPIYPKGKAR